MKLLLVSTAIFAVTFGLNTEGLDFPGLEGWELTDNSVLDFERMMLHINYKYNTDQAFKMIVDAHNRDWPPYANDTLDIPDFNCEIEYSEEHPTSVHALRPSDIGIVAAFGDSITAGFGIGAETLLEVGNQVRGESWSVGGDYSLEKNVITVPNILHKFNAELKGYSSCITGSSDVRRGRFNVAVGGATSVQMESQANTMVDRMKNYVGINYENDWKMVTMFIGGNDLCRSCRFESHEPENYADGVKRALDVLHQEMPRALVNLVPMFDVSPLTNMSTGLPCDIMHRIACRCAITEENREIARAHQREYYERLQTMVDSGMWDTRDDFTVVMQPYLVDMEPWVDPDTGDWDTSIFSPDCFHFNRKGHQLIALGLWNTMLMPAGRKPHFYFPDPEILVIECPRENSSYIFTEKNSKCIEWEGELINCPPSTDPPTPSAPPTPTNRPTDGEVGGATRSSPAKLTAVILCILTIFRSFV